jgi:polysaccharide pyruvyl transferase WcaK-like protein
MKKMRIAYFINTFRSINWGGQATSSGIQYMIDQAYPEAEFVPLILPNLPFKKIKILRKYYEYSLVKSILLDDLEQVYYYLKKMNIPSTIFDGFSHICFNGEGAVHYKSGHIRVFMGLLYIAKKQGKVVASVNQTIDLNEDKMLERLISKVYNSVDFVSVREPLSYDYAKKIGIQNVQLIPDAVYGLPKMNSSEIKTIVEKYHLPKQYITVTGSSILKRDERSLEKMKQIIHYAQAYFQMPMVFMANAKTDIWIAHKLKNEFDFIIIEPPVKYKDAMAIIANCEILIGGRQHPNIFAYIYEVPYVPFPGNTFKNEGVAKLQNYPLVPLLWDVNNTDFINAVEKVYKQKNIFNTINIDKFEIFDWNTHEICENESSDIDFKTSKLIVNDAKYKDSKEDESRSIKRVGLVITNLAGSGAEKVVLHMARMFKSKDIDVHIFLLENVMTYDHIDDLEIHFLRGEKTAELLKKKDCTVRSMKVKT